MLGPRGSVRFASGPKEATHQKRGERERETDLGVFIRITSFSYSSKHGHSINSAMLLPWKFLHKQPQRRFLKRIPSLALSLFSLENICSRTRYTKNKQRTGSNIKPSVLPYKEGLCQQAPSPSLYCLSTIDQIAINSPHQTTRTPLFLSLVGEEFPIFSLYLHKALLVHRTHSNPSWTIYIYIYIYLFIYLFSYYYFF